MSSMDTIWPADSVEFCPHPAATDVFVCATYKLEQPDSATSEETINEVAQSESTERLKQKRRGKCLLFAADEPHTDHFSLVHETALPAVPDVKWCHREASVTPILAAANTEGHITLHEYNSEKRILQQFQELSCASDDVLVLSLDWSNRRHPTSSFGSLVASLSDGSLVLLRAGDGNQLSITEKWHAHDYEPWIAAWNYWDTNVLYSGGDDLKMRGWDVRAGFSQSISTNKRFEAGVTTIQSHPFIEHLLAVGSYDNTVRLFDVRNPLKPLTQIDVGGGAWRVKWHPSPGRKQDLLVACMHDGCKILRFDFREESGSRSDITLQANSHTLVKRFDDHASMAYGADWSFAPSSGRQDTLVASCSFYDHSLKIWRG